MTDSHKEIDEKILFLEKELSYERQKRKELEEECNLLAEDNARLHAEIDSLIALKIKNKWNSQVENDQLAHSKVIVERNENDRFVKKIALKIENACDGKNVLSVSFLKLDQCLYLLCGGADHRLNLFDSSIGLKLDSVQMTAPILVIKVFENFIATGLMNGELVIVIKIFLFYSSNFNEITLKLFILL